MGPSHTLRLGALIPKGHQAAGHPAGEDQESFAHQKDPAVGQVTEADAQQGSSCKAPHQEQYLGMGTLILGRSMQKQKFSWMLRPLFVQKFLFSWGKRKTWVDRCTVYRWIATSPPKSPLIWRFIRTQWVFCCYIYVLCIIYNIHVTLHIYICKYMYVADVHMYMYLWHGTMQYYTNQLDRHPGLKMGHPKNLTVDHNFPYWRNCHLEHTSFFDIPRINQTGCISNLRPLCLGSSSTFHLGFLCC